MNINDIEKKRRGTAAEEFICMQLEKKGCNILERNFSAGRLGEIDIIAMLGEKLLVIEVRARQKDNRFGSPFDTINSAKLTRIRNSINVYLQKHRIMNSYISVLAAAVYMNSEGVIMGFDIVPVENL